MASLWPIYLYLDVVHNRNIKDYYFWLFPKHFSFLSCCLSIVLINTFFEWDKCTFMLKYSTQIMNKAYHLFKLTKLYLNMFELKQIEIIYFISYFFFKFKPWNYPFLHSIIKMSSLIQEKKCHKVLIIWKSQSSKKL